MSTVELSIKGIDLLIIYESDLDLTKQSKEIDIEFVFINQVDALDLLSDETKTEIETRIRAAMYEQRQESF